MMRIETKRPKSPSLLQLLPARIHYDEDWNLKLEIIGEVWLLPARIHYDEDWNLAYPCGKKGGSCFQPVSIMMRIETALQNFLISQPIFFQPVSIMMRIETWPYRVITAPSKTSSPYPLWWGLKLPANSARTERRLLPARIHYDEDWNKCPW